jgi:hypothetical protein
MPAKSNLILFWITTLIIVLFDGVMPLMYLNSEQAREGISHLGYPDYFRVMLTIFKVAGAAVLVIPAIRGWIREWAYAGFAFDFFSASVSHTVVDGFGFNSIFPIFFLILLFLSRYAFRKYFEGVRPDPSPVSSLT